MSKTLIGGAAMLLAVAVSACGQGVPAAAAAAAPAAAAADVDVAAEAAIQGVQVSDAVLRPPLGGRDVTSAQFNLVSGSDDALVGARSDIAEMIEVHIHEMEDGVMRMRRVDAYDLPAGETITPDDRGLHLMLFGVAEIAEGQTVQIVLELQSGAEKTVDFKVKTPDEAGSMKH